MDQNLNSIYSIDGHAAEVESVHDVRHTMQIPVHLTAKVRIMPVTIVQSIVALLHNRQDIVQQQLVDLHWHIWTIPERKVARLPSEKVQTVSQKWI